MRPAVEVDFSGSSGNCDMSLQYWSDCRFIVVIDGVTIILPDYLASRLVSAILPYFSMEHDDTVRRFQEIVRRAVTGECNARRDSDLRCDDMGVRKAVAKAFADLVCPLNLTSDHMDAEPREVRS